MTDSTELIKQAQQGNRVAFGKILDCHYETLLRFAYKFSGNQQDAEDIAQQTCVRLAQALPQFRFESLFSTWLYRVALNCARDFYRSQRPLRETESLMDDASENQQAETSIMLEQILLRVDAMGEGFRETLVLVHGEGLTHAEAAELLGVKESTVSWRLHEIRKRLKTEMPRGESV